MATNLFAMPGTVGGQSGNKPLVEFKAGKMNYTESTKKVVPDKRKGLIQLTQTPDALMHFIWKDRTTGQAEPDLIIFPEEAVFKRVKQCTTGRVYLLEFKTSRKLFFWMQEGSDAKDQENCNKINEYINNPPNGSEASPSHTGGAGMPTGMDQNALFQMFSQRAQQARGSAASGAGGAPVVGMGDLQSILTQIGMPTSAISGMLGRQGQQSAPSMRGAQPPQQQPTSASQPGQPGQPQARAPRLSTLVNSETVRPLLNNPAIQERLLPYLPAERRTPEEFRDILSSPQFQQSLDAFGEALESGQLTELVRQFGLPTSGPTSIQQFLQAVQAQAQQGQQGQGQQQQGGEKKPDQKDDDKMDTK